MDLSGRAIPARPLTMKGNAIMRRRHVLLLVATLVVAISATLGCSSPTAPTPPTSPPTPAPPAQVVAPPPAGVSPELWLVGFHDDNKLYRPTEPIHLNVEGLPEEARAIIAERAATASAYLAGRQVWTVGPGPGPGINFRVTVAGGGISCGGKVITAGACTSFGLTQLGGVTGGGMQFTSLQVIMQSPWGVLHEICRTMGIWRSPPEGFVSILAVKPAREPTEEDLKVLRGRYDYPLLAVYSGG